MIDRLVRLERDGRADLRRRGRMIAALVGDEPEQVNGIRIARVRTQQRAVLLFRAVQITALVQPDRRFQAAGLVAAEPGLQRLQQ